MNSIKDKIILSKENNETKRNKLGILISEEVAITLKRDKVAKIRNKVRDISILAFSAILIYSAVTGYIIGYGSRPLWFSITQTASMLTILISRLILDILYERYNAQLKAIERKLLNI